MSKHTTMDKTATSSVVKRLGSPEITAIECPACGTAFPLSEALGRHVGLQMQAIVNERIAHSIEGERARILAEAQGRIEAQSAELETARAELRTFRQHELKLHKRERDVADRETALAIEFEQRIQTELARIRGDERKRVQAEASRRQSELSLEIERLKAELTRASGTEAELLKLRTESEQLRTGLEIEVQRRMEGIRQRDLFHFEQQRELSVRKALAEAKEKHSLTEKEQSLLIERLNAQIMRLQRAATPGSSELRGEQLELVVRDRLREAFPQDELVDVSRGKAGGDVLLVVHAGHAQPAGRILFEAKNTQQWANRWPEKALSDQRAARADLAVIVSVATPKSVGPFGYHEGVWVTEPGSLVALVVALRQGIVRYASMRTAAAARDAHLQGLFDYLVSADFRTQVQSMMAAVHSMLSDLDSEQRTTTRIWARRRRQIEQLSNSTSTVIGSLECATGKALTEDGHSPMISIAELPGTSDSPREAAGHDCCTSAAAGETE